VIAGEGPLRDAITAQAAPLGDTVVMAGLRTDAMALLDASDVLLYPSRVESLPTAIIEALAARVPVVASTAGGIPEIVQDGVSGALVPTPPQPQALADALAGLLGDPERRRAMAGAGRARFEERFSADAWALRLRPIYADAVRTRSP
jgi:glycosyltransferase involved in cell wall biosynthesis